MCSMQLDGARQAAWQANAGEAGVQAKDPLLHVLGWLDAVTAGPQGWQSAVLHRALAAMRSCTACETGKGPTSA